MPATTSNKLDALIASEPDREVTNPTLALRHSLQQALAADLFNLGPFRKLDPDLQEGILVAVTLAVLRRIVCAQAENSFSPKEIHFEGEDYPARVKSTVRHMAASIGAQLANGGLVRVAKTRAIRRDGPPILDDQGRPVFGEVYRAAVFALHPASEADAHRKG